MNEGAYTAMLGAAGGSGFAGLSDVRPIREIAQEIAQDWKKPYFGAVPYLQAMSVLESIEDEYGYDSAREIVLYFLSNATTWRGPKAREIKEELKKMLAAGRGG
jgi:hypothetical protein